MSQEELLPFGERLPDQDPLNLTIPEARRTAMAVLRNPDLTLRGLRSITVGGNYSEVLVVDCTCDAVWSQNPAGIRYREALALRFYADRDRMPEARALRRDFPVLLHTNDVPS
jgi:Prokaryotic E2 family A